MAGIYELTLKRMVFEIGVESEAVLKAFKGFGRNGKAFIINNTHVWMCNFVKNQKMNTNMKISASKLIDELSNDVLEEMNTKNHEAFVSLMKQYGKPFEAFVNPSENMKGEIESEMESEMEKESIQETECEDAENASSFPLPHLPRSPLFSIPMETSDANHTKAVQARIKSQMNLTRGIPLPYESRNFRQKLYDYFEHKAVIKSPYQTTKGISAIFNKMEQHSEKEVVESIDRTLASGDWKSIYFEDTIKKTNGTTTHKRDALSSRANQHLAQNDDDYKNY